MSAPACIAPLRPRSTEGRARRRRQQAALAAALVESPLAVDLAAFRRLRGVRRRVVAELARTATPRVSGSELVTACTIHDLALRTLASPASVFGALRSAPVRAVISTVVVCADGVDFVLAAPREHANQMYACLPHALEILSFEHGPRDVARPRPKTTHGDPR